MISRDDYTVRLVDLPAGVGGFITESSDGFLNIYINARHSREGQRRSLRHELRHAEHDDLRSSEPLAVIEARADGADQRLKSIPKLLRARDLLPKSPPHLVRGKRARSLVCRKVAERSEVGRGRPLPSPAPRPLTPCQARVLANCITELDRCFFNVPTCDN